MKENKVMSKRVSRIVLQMMKHLDEEMVKRQTSQARLQAEMSIESIDIDAVTVNLADGSEH